MKTAEGLLIAVAGRKRDLMPNHSMQRPLIAIVRRHKAGGPAQE